MASKIRVLGIAPYENMGILMSEAAKDYDNIDLTVCVGDLAQGVEMAKQNFYRDYDIIISRGGTATMLREDLSLPVVEIQISPDDIIRAMRLAEDVTDHYAIVGFPNITVSAGMLCDLMQYRIDVYTVHDVDEVKPTLEMIRSKGTRTILCDMIAHTTARQLGLDVILITSGMEGIHMAFDEAIRQYDNYRTLREENRFLRSLIWNQVNDTVVFDDKGELFLSTVENTSSPIMDYLREESRRDQTTHGKRHILKQINNVRYSIHAGQETFGDSRYTTYYFSESRVSSSDIRRGIRYVGQPEAEEQYEDSIFGIVGAVRDVQEEADRINATSQPVLICGEDGTCKEEMVNYLYLNSAMSDRPLVIIDCYMLDDKAWEYLMNSHNSPFAKDGCTIFIKNIDILAYDRCHQMLANIMDMGVYRRNRLIASCIQSEDAISANGLEFRNRLCSFTIRLQPLREKASQLPAMANIYMSYLNSVQSRQIAGFDPDAMEQLQEFDWPHNYTQLQRVLRDLSQLADGPNITAENTGELLKKERNIGVLNPEAEDKSVPLDLDKPLDQINCDIARRVLAEENGNQSRTAQRLGIGRTTLWRMLNQ